MGSENGSSLGYRHHHRSTECDRVFYSSADENLEHTIGATFLPFELVILSVSRPCGAKADQLSRDVGETPLQPPGALPPNMTVDRRFAFNRSRLSG